MEHLPRPESPRQARPGSKFSQTFSRFKGIIRIPALKATPNATQKPPIQDNRSRTNAATMRNHPYHQKTSNTATMRERMLVKPYMSQPMLTLQRSSMDTDPYPHSQPSDPDSETSSSPDPSPCSMTADFPLPKHTEDSRRRSRRLSFHSLSSPHAEGFGVQKQLEVPLSPSPPTPLPKPPNRPTPNFSLPRRLADTSGELPIPTEAPALPALPSLVIETSSTHPPRVKPPRPVRPLPPVPPELPPTRNSFSQRRDEATTPKPLVPSMAVAPSESSSSSSSDRGGGGAQRKEPPPKLTLPTTLNRRISLLQAAGGAARLSPTIMHRPPPLPILNLPKLPEIQHGDRSGLPEESSLMRRRSERAGLGDMPALPIQGTHRGAGGHEEVDDMEDDDDDEDDEEEEEGEGDETDDGHEMSCPRTSTSTESDEGAGLFGRGSYDLPSVRPELPPLSLDSPFEIRFQSDSGTTNTSGSTSGMIGGLEVPGPSSTTGSYHADKKGKQKQVFPTSPLSSGYTTNSDASSQALSSASSMGVEFSRQLHHHRPSLSVTTSNNSSYHSLASATEYFDAHSRDRTPSGQLHDPFMKAQATSPLATPRALSHFEVPKLRDAPAANSKNSSNRNSIAFEASANANASLLVQRPSMFKRASRSLVDIHAMAKREEVEKIVREEEEEQERVRRRTSIRRSVNVGGEGSESCLPMHRASMLGKQQQRFEAMSEEEEEQMLPKREGGGVPAGTGIPGTTATTTLLVSEGGPSIENPHYAGAVTGSNLAVAGVSGAGASIVGGSSPGLNKRESVVSRRVISAIMDSAATLDGSVVEGKQQKQQALNRLSLAPAYETLQPLQQPQQQTSGAVRRRRSMPTFNENTAPPPYPTFAPRPYGMDATIRITPREDEGKEVLPAYSNSIYLKAIMPLKMEFSAPGVQAKDRKWKRVLCILEGTMLKVYRCPSGPGGVSVIEQWWERKVGAGDHATLAPPTVPGTVAAARAAATEEARRELEERRVEEKMQQQYLAGNVQEELPVDGGGAASSSQTPLQSATISTSSLSHRQVKEHSAGQTHVAITKSALNLAVQFLKPGSRHGRSNSDSGPPSPSMMFVPPGAPRPSLNIPRTRQTTPTSSTFTSSSRSHSPMPSSSSSITAQGSKSHSPLPPSRPSSRLNVRPTTSSSNSSRPPTPNTGSSGRSSSRMKTNHGGTASRSVKSDHFDPNPQELLRCYTMQNAESGLGNDYVKRKNVIRVRLEGEQFLLQAKDIPSVVQWIEGLQAASNVALDLDERPMPRGPIFPRRRRRRRPQVAPILTNNPNAPPRPATVVETYTPTSATAGQPALRRIS